MEALIALGFVNSLTRLQEVNQNMGALQALCEDCTIHIEEFKMGAFKGARLLLKST